ncbi:MAG TPA: SRPBCC family protein [Solirubrobacteraceae bacterium]|nr:SRPBCC family protein [Solirubrobacteraceae bacterium]
MRRLASLGAGFAGACGLYLLVARGAVTIDLGIGREVRALRTIKLAIAAPPETVFDVVAAPYLGRTARAMAEKLEVWERGSDMALAAHFTPVNYGMRTTTVETVRFTRPERIDFRLLRGPVPHVRETFELHPTESGTELEYNGEIGTDLWAVGRWWGRAVAGHWERAVESSLDGIRLEAERLAGRSRPSSTR